MPNQQEYGPRKYINLGVSRLWRPNLMRLHTHWRDGTLVFCLGAGVSIPYGLPNWNGLVLSLLARLDSFGDTRGRERVDGWHAYYPQYRRALGEWMMDHFKFEPVKLARVFAYDEQLKTKIRRELYAPLAPPAPGCPGRTSLDAVAALIAEGQRDGNPIPAVITLNYDDLLEMKLREAEILCTSVFDRNPKVEGIPIYHVHGFLPRDGVIPDQDLVFTESDYHEISSSGFHWSVKTMMRYLHTHNVLFVGVSMNDPNLRRFLDNAHAFRQERRHLAIREDYHIPDDKLEPAMEEIERKALRFGQEIGRNETKKLEQLRDAIRDVCGKAHDYDKKTLNSLGVRPIWVRDNADICRVLDVVRTGVPDE